MKGLERKSSWRLYKNAWIFLEESKENLLSKEEAKSILKDKGWMIRNTYDFDTKEETSFWFVIKDKLEDISELPSSTRKKIRRALKIYNFRIITLEELRTIAYNIVISAEQSYNNLLRHTTKDSIECLIDEYKNDGNKEYWCVENKISGEIVGFSVNTIKADSCEYDNAKCKWESLHDCSQPFYGLFYTMNQYYLGEKKLKYVCDGSRTITEHSNIQDYLIYNFKFRKAYCKLKIHYKWWLGVVIKVLFPFRNIIPFRKVKAVLKMEAYSRGLR